MKVSIVIPTYNRYDLLHQLLFDIYQKCSLVHEVLVVDDCSPDPAVMDGLRWWKEQKLIPIRHIKLNKNVMFLRASNEGMKRAEGDMILLISTDVRIHKDVVGFIDGSDPKELLLFGGRLLDWDTGWNTFGKRTFPYLEGWFLAAHADIWKKLNYFDDRFAPSDMEDVDISTAAIENGYSLAPLPPDYLSHIGGQSIGYNPAREAITLANKEKFRRKWILNEVE